MASLPYLEFPEYYDEKNIKVPVVERARITCESYTDKHPDRENTIDCYVAGLRTYFPALCYFIAKPENVERIDGYLFISIGGGELEYQTSIIEYKILEDLREAQKPAIKLWKKRMKKLGYTGYVSDGDCFVATATFGSPDDLTVIRLRRFRDTRLCRSYLGRQIIKIYQSFGPHAARLVNRYSVSKRFIAPCLKLIACFCNQGQSEKTDGNKALPLDQA